MDYHLATEPPVGRTPGGWAHAVPNHPATRLTVCGLPVGALTDWPDLPYPHAPADFGYCPGCAAGVRALDDLHREDRP